MVPPTFRKDQLEPGTLVDGYRIERVIGVGGMSTVYRARKVRSGEVVALKVLRDGGLATQNMRRRFRQEALTLQRLSHPNVVRVLDMSDSEFGGWMALELYSDSSLADDLQSGGPMFPSDAVSLMCDVLSALQTAHDAGVIHRDIKPDNILIGMDGRPRLCDFGVAHSDESTPSLNGIGTILGTLAYMAPEQRFCADLDGRADIFACGVTLYQMLTGRGPADLVTEDVRNNLGGLGVPEDLQSIVLRATEWRRDDRFPSAFAMKQALAAAAANVVDLDPAEPFEDPTTWNTDTFIFTPKPPPSRVQPLDGQRPQLPPELAEADTIVPKPVDAPNRQSSTLGGKIKHTVGERVPGLLAFLGLDGG